MAQPSLQQIEDIRKALGIEDLRAAEYIFAAIEAMSLVGDITPTQVQKALDKGKPSSADLTMQMLQAKYQK